MTTRTGTSAEPTVSEARGTAVTPATGRHTVIAMPTTPTPPTTPARGRGRPRGGDPAQTRERILAAAAEQFAESGYHGTTMVAVAKAAGLSQTGLLHHFPTKEELLAGVLERRDIEDTAGLWDDSLRGWEWFDALVRLAKHNESREVFVRLFTAMAGEAVDDGHPGHAWLRSHHDAARRVIARALAQAKEDGTCHPDAPADLIAQATVAVMDGLQLQWLAEPAVTEMAAPMQAHVDAVRARWEIPSGAR
ncbi:TetR/AcrR family transcriptional regulator [Knoellia remsis]|nr:TetR/AcrR family transcriptional regulator [Knoellia remsis]